MYWDFNIRADFGVVFIGDFVRGWGGGLFSGWRLGGVFIFITPLLQLWCFGSMS